ncbi:MAG: DUF4384 domain-containing protein [Desulfomonile tiedjei]|nr:DUF4384 domain-containing protein [Desulfomonile tiedjei]
MKAWNRISSLAMILLIACLLLSAWDASTVLAKSRTDSQAEKREFKVRLWTDENKSVYRIGDKIRLRFEANKDCYLTLIDIGTSGEVSILFPNKWHPDNRVEKGKTYSVPASGSGIIFRIRGPEGTEVVKAVATLTREETARRAGESSRDFAGSDRPEMAESWIGAEASALGKQSFTEAELRLRIVRSGAATLAAEPETSGDADSEHSRNHSMPQPTVAEPSLVEKPRVAEKPRAIGPQPEKPAAHEQPVDPKPEQAPAPQPASTMDAPAVTPEKVEPPKTEAPAKTAAAEQPVAEPNPQPAAQEQPVERKPEQAPPPQTASTVDAPAATPEKVEPPKTEAPAIAGATEQPVAEPSPQPAAPEQPVERKPEQAPAPHTATTVDAPAVTPEKVEPPKTEAPPKTGAAEQPLVEPSPTADQGKTIEAVALSLTVLQERLKECADTGRCSDDARFLGGMRELLGYCLDKENGDLILLGSTAGGGPRLHTEDLLVALKNAWAAQEFPGCSIDPDPEVMRQLQGVDASGDRVLNERDLEKANRKWQNLCQQPQAVRVMGVPFDSRFSKIMVEADYFMKRLVDGSENLDIRGFQSVTDKMLAAIRQDASRGKAAVPPMIFNRFWFAPKESAYLEEDDAIWVKRVAVGLSTEEELLTGTGQVTQSGKPHPLADEFARSFTEKYGEIASARPIYQELAHLYRFVALAQIIKMRNAPDEAGADLIHLLEYSDTSGNEVQRQLPGIPHFKKLSVSHGQTGSVFYVRNCGGVLMNIEPERASIAYADTGSAKVRDSVVKSRPAERSLAWNVTVRVPRELLEQATSDSQL